MYVYTDQMFAPTSLLAEPNPITPHQAWELPLVPFIHKVNTPERARKKDDKYAGFEVDVLSLNGQLLAAHDKTQAAHNILLKSIFAAVKNPAEKIWWLDIKGTLTDKELKEIVHLAQQYNIAKNHLLFEAPPGPLAQRIAQKNLGLLLALPDGFNQDQANRATRDELNKKIIALWEQYHPLALSASFGKYAYLRAYFPQVPKAIYYSATKRPSIKKFFMRRHMKQDPSVKIFMTDEYDWINL